uniref:hypothetical protein n=1 Tax=Nocardiopsis lucentensis TaxID=53441 RepID=UPI00059267D3
PVLPRRGHAHVNTALDEIVGETGWLTTGQLAELITIDTILGEPNTPSSGPVGLWVVAQLQANGVPAVAYSWASTLCVYDPALRLIGEVTVPNGHTLYELECEVNDGDRPELVRHGEEDPR